MILIPHGWITSSVAPSRRENTIVVAGRALGSGAREGYIRAWPARGPRTVRTSTLRGAPRCAAPAAAWRRSEACGSAALGGARCPRQHGGARQRSCPGQALRHRRSAARRCTRRNSVSRGEDVAGGSPRGRFAALVPVSGVARSPVLISFADFGSAPMHGSWVRSLRGPRVRSLRGPRVRSHARSSGPFPYRFSGPLPQVQTLMSCRRFSGPLPQVQTMMSCRRFSGPLPQFLHTRALAVHRPAASLVGAGHRGRHGTQ